VIYRIADFDINLEKDTKRTKEAYAEYVSENNTFDFSLSITKEEVLAFQGGKDTYIYKDSVAVYYHKKLAEELPLHNAFVLHSATFDVDGIGVAFAAHSGTGKTTHMNLWQELLGEKMVVVNGDKPIVRFFDDEPEQPYAYGTPWMGKERLGCNMRTPLKNICFIERSKTNYVEKLDKKSAIDRVFNQVYMPENSSAKMNTVQLIDRLLTCCDLWIIHCNMEMDAAKVAYNTIFKK